MKNTIIISVLVLGVALIVGEHFLSKRNARPNMECSANGMATMGSFFDGEKIDSIVAKIQKSNLSYTIWNDGEEIIEADARKFSVANEILLTAAESGKGALVGSKEQIRLLFNKEGKLVQRNCVVILTGP